MSAVLNRTTKQFLSSANTPDYPASEWIINPDLSAVSAYDSKYWVIQGDNVILMNQSARDSIDDAENDLRKDSIVNDNALMSEVLLDEINALRGIHDLPLRTMADIEALMRSKINGNG